MTAFVLLVVFAVSTPVSLGGAPPAVSSPSAQEHASFDGEYVWLEGVALVGLYVMIAAAFWWG